MKESRPNNANTEKGLASSVSAMSRNRTKLNSTKFKLPPLMTSSDMQYLYLVSANRQRDK